jgi:small multidrug resistance family-3 protein
VREHRGVVWIGAGIIALGLDGFVATLQADPNFDRILAAYGGVFVSGSLAWGVALDGFRPDRSDIIGAIVCLVGVAVIMYAPRSAARTPRGTAGAWTAQVRGRELLGVTRSDERAARAGRGRGSRWG